MQTFFEDIDRMDLCDEASSNILTNECGITSSNKPDMASLTPPDDRNVFIFPSDAITNNGFADINEMKELNNLSSSDPLMGSHINTALNLSNTQSVEIFNSLRSMYNLGVEQQRGTLHLREMQVNEKQTMLAESEELTLKVPLIQSKDHHLTSDEYCKPSKLEKRQMNIQTKFKPVELLDVSCGKMPNETEKVSNL